MALLEASLLSLPSRPTTPQWCEFSNPKGFVAADHRITSEPSRTSAAVESSQPMALRAPQITVGCECVCGKAFFSRVFVEGTCPFSRVNTDEQGGSSSRLVRVARVIQARQAERRLERLQEREVRVELLAVNAMIVAIAVIGLDNHQPCW